MRARLQEEEILKKGPDFSFYPVQNIQPLVLLLFLVQFYVLPYFHLQYFPGLRYQFP